MSTTDKLPSFTRVRGFCCFASSDRAHHQSEVAKHNQVTDLWVIVGDSVYNLTSFLYEHPGGESAFLDHAGKDGTKAYRVVYNHEYKENADMLAKLKIGTVREAEGIEAMREEDMLHASVGHSTASGPPHVIIMMAVTALCGLAVHYWSLSAL
jgi:cytochrome b involved in lipid metabolism